MALPAQFHKCNILKKSNGHFRHTAWWQQLYETNYLEDGTMVTQAKSVLEIREQVHWSHKSLKLVD